MKLKQYLKTPKLFAFIIILFWGIQLGAQDNRNPQSLPEEDIPTWKTLTKKELPQKLKKYAYAKIRMSMKSPLEYKEEALIFYTPCPSIFPKLLGDLPCNFLEWDKEQQSITQSNKANEFREGGEVTVYISSGKSKLLNGVSLLLSASPPEEKTKSKPKIDPRDIQIFYNSANQISHYRMGNKAVLFYWQKENGSPTLKSMLEVDLNSSLWVDSAKEVDFSQ